MMVAAVERHRCGECSAVLVTVPSRWGWLRIAAAIRAAAAEHQPACEGGR